MNIVEATFRIVTPLFMSGADQEKAELRVPSIKGALRFWWRALALGRLGSVKEVRKAEAELFGSSDKKIGQSKVLMRLLEQKTTKNNNKKLSMSDWRSYVGYGLSEKASEKPREYIEPDSQFKLELIMKESVSEDQKQQICSALKALGLIGGLGSRSRKGWGSLSLNSLEGENSQWRGPSDSDGYRKEIDALLSKGANVTDQPNYTAFSSKTRIEIGPMQENAQVAQQYIKDVMQKEEREAVGFPRKKNMNRRGSPLFLHVHELGNEYVPVASFFPAQFLPNIPEPSGGYTVINSFLDRFSQGVKQ